MEANFNKKEGIKKQIRESYGKLVYSYTTHLKFAQLLEKKHSIIKWILIVLSASSTCGLLGVLIDWNTRLLAIITTILTTISLALSTYLKSANFETQIVKHRETAHALWVLREKYISILTDFDDYSENELKEIRDNLTKSLSGIYKNEPMTDSKSYQMAQRALKEQEEQFFTDDEIDKMLPSHLRIK